MDLLVTETRMIVFYSLISCLVTSDDQITFVLDGRRWPDILNPR